MDTMNKTGKELYFLYHEMREILPKNIDLEPEREYHLTLDNSNVIVHTTKGELIFYAKLKKPEGKEETTNIELYGKN